MAVRWNALTAVTPFALMSMSASQAVYRVNSGFEESSSGWSDGDATESATSRSDVAHSGTKSAKPVENGAYISQTMTVQPKATYRLGAYLRGPGNVGVNAGTELFLEQPSKPGKQWQEVVVTCDSGEHNRRHWIATKTN